MLKIGIVGGGHIVNHRHIPVFKKIKAVEVSAVCDMQESVARSTAQQFGIRKFYTSLSDMVSKQKIDIVDICTPPKTHVFLAGEAMDAGCHVLAEKPLAMTPKDVDLLYEKARKNNVKLCVVHQNLFNPVVMKAKQMVESGVVGDVISIDVGTFVRRDNYMCVNGKHWCHFLTGGIFFEILPHPVYLLQMFVKEAKPSSILTAKLSEYPWMKADELRVLAKGKHNIGSLVASCNSPFHGDSLDIFGTKMALHADLWGRSILKFKPRTEDPVSVGKANLSMAGQLFGVLGANASNLGRTVFGGVKVSAHYGFLNQYVKSILEDSEPPVSAETARENVRIVEDICSQIEKSF
jgi:predicted dehydrogenase